jgi:hypothetical protein
MADKMAASDRTMLAKPVHLHGDNFIQTDRVFGQYGFDLFEGKPKLFQRQNLLKALEIGIGVQPVPGLGASGRRKQTDLIVIPQRADCKTGHFRQFAHLPLMRHVHLFPLSPACSRVSSI